MSHSSDCSPLAYRGRSMCLAAPAEAGQGVGTLSAFGLKHLNALRVLTAMQKEKFRQGDFDSAECEALEMALYALNLRIEERGYRA